MVSEKRTFTGKIDAGILTRGQLDPNVVTQDVTAFIGTGILAFLAHAFYRVISPAKTLVDGRRQRHISPVVLYSLP